MAARKLLFYNLLVTLLQLVSGNIKTLAYDLFPTHPLSTSVNEGDPVILDCIVSLPVRQCYWTRDANQYRVTPGVTQNYAFVGNKIQGDCSMKIDKSTIDQDDGNWTCHVITTNDEQGTSHPAVLTVQTPPDIILAKDSEPVPMFKNISLQMGENASDSISCIAQKCNPPAHIVWLMGFDQMPAIFEVEPDFNSKTFTVRSWPNILVAEQNHKKLVRCQVNHPSFWQPVEKKFNLLVRHPTSSVSIWVTQTKNILNEDRVRVHVGHPISLHCEANGFPKPKYKWKKVNDKQKTTILNSGPLLQVGNNIDDEGIYTCFAKNEINKAIVFANRSVHVKMEYAARNVSMILDVRDQLAEGSIVTLTCKADGFPTPEIRWLKGLDDLRIPISVGEKLVFRNFSAGDQGLYQCTAFNTHNSKEIASNTIHLQIPGMKIDLNSAAYWSESYQTKFLCLSIWIYLYFFHVHMTAL